MNKKVLVVITCLTLIALLIGTIAHLYINKEKKAVTNDNSEIINEEQQIEDIGSEEEMDTSIYTKDIKEYKFKNGDKLTINLGSCSQELKDGKEIMLSYEDEEYYISSFNNVCTEKITKELYKAYSEIYGYIPEIYIKGRNQLNSSISIGGVTLTTDKKYTPRIYITSFNPSRGAYIQIEKIIPLTGEFQAFDITTDPETIIVWFGPAPVGCLAEDIKECPLEREIIRENCKTNQLGLNILNTKTFQIKRIYESDEYKDLCKSVQ